MRASVTAAWPAMCRFYEGVTTWMYLDTKGLVTTGVGFLVDTIAGAQALPWLKKDGTRASAGEIQTEWKRVKAQQAWKKYNGLNAVWRNSAVLHLDMATVDRLLLAKTAEFWTRLARTISALEAFPADAQLALMDESWQNGPAFLDANTSWVGTRAAVIAQDWAAAASHVPGTGARADRRKRLFTNAATVVRLGLDRDQLWDNVTPVKTTPPVVVTPPKETDVPVNFRGGRTCTCVAISLPLVEQDMIRRGLIKQSIDIFQLGYRNDVGASAGTHAGGGNTDVAQFSDAQIDVWRLWGWTIQHRTKAQGFDMDHGHGWPLGCNHLSPGGRAQAAQWANRQNGLVSRGRIDGRWPIDDWKTAMKKRLAEIDETNKQKELELPTVSEVAKALANDKNFLAAVAAAVVNADLVPNEWDDKATNEFVSLKTSLRRADGRVIDIDAKLDALIARFPVQPPAPPTV